MYVVSVYEKLYNLISEKLLLPTTEIKYATTIKTKNEPICVQIKKYNEAWTARRDGLTK